MPAIAANLDYILIVCISAVIAAKFVIAAHCASAAFMPAPVVIFSHISTPICSKIVGRKREQSTIIIQ
jgi:hypothetical protein